MSLRRLRSEQGGFTLIELLVAMAMGLIVIAGASMVMIGALTDSDAVAARVRAVQNGRTGMEQLIQLLNSGCLASDVSPVQSATASGISPAVSSDDNHLVFVSGLGDSANVIPTENVVSIVNGALVDVQYAGTGQGNPPGLGVPATWTYSTTPTATLTLIEHAAAQTATPPATAPHLFQYYSYSNPSNPTPNSLANAAPMSPLSLDAPSVAQVGINVETLPANAGQNASSEAALDDVATFRLTPADPSATNYPCD